MLLTFSSLLANRVACWDKFYECEGRCFGNKFFFAEAIPWRRKLLWTKRQKLCELFFVTPLCKMRPVWRKTRLVTLTNDNCVSGKTIAIFLYRGFLW